MANTLPVSATQITVPAQNIQLTQEWDKIFPKSTKVEHRKVTFKNRFGITLVGDLYIPKNAKGKLPAITFSGPFGAVKEQTSGLYAQTMAERGFVTLAFDGSYTGESSGLPRNMPSPEINSEDFSASIDYLSSLEIVDKDKIGIFGICGWGGFALNAASSDPRAKAVATSTMYDMTRVVAESYAIDMHPNDLVLLQHDGFVSTRKLYVPAITKAVLQATGYLLELEESQIQVNPDAHFLKAQNKNRSSERNPMLARFPAGFPNPSAS